MLSHQRTTSMSMRARVRSSQKAKAKEEKEKEESRIGVYLVMTTGSRKVANMAIIVQNIIPDDNQEDVQYVALLDTIPLSVPDQSSPRQRMSSMMRIIYMGDWRVWSFKRPERKRKEVEGKSKGKSTPRSNTPRPVHQAQTDTSK